MSDQAEPYDPLDPEHLASMLSNDLDYLREHCPAIAETVEQARDYILAHAGQESSK